MTPAPQVPEAAVKAIVAERCERLRAAGHEPSAEFETKYGDAAREQLELALPAIHSARDQEVREKLLSDEAINATTEVLDDEFAAKADGEAVTDYALAKRILRAALDAALSPSPAEPCERCGDDEEIEVTVGIGNDRIPERAPCPDCGTGEKQPEPGEGEQGA